MMNYCALLHKACCYILIRNWDAQRKYSFYFQSIYITNTFLGLNIFIYQNQFDIGPHRLIRAFCCQRISSFCFNKYASWIEFINFILSALRYKERCSCIDQIKYNQFTFGCMYINGFFFIGTGKHFYIFCNLFEMGKKTAVRLVFLAFHIWEEKNKWFSNRLCATYNIIFMNVCARLF